MYLKILTMPDIITLMSRFVNTVRSSVLFYRNVSILMYEILNSFRICVPRSNRLADFQALRAEATEDAFSGHVLGDDSILSFADGADKEEHFVSHCIPCRMGLHQYTIQGREVNPLRFLKVQL